MSKCREITQCNEKIMPKSFIKYIGRLPKKERDRLFAVIEQIVLLQLDGLDMKKLQ